MALKGPTSGPSDSLRHDVFRMSRSFAVTLLLIYVCSRIYLHDPLGDDADASMPHPEIPAEALRKEQEVAEAEPDVNPWACITLLVITVALMSVTTEILCFTRHFPLARDIISSFPAASRQHKSCPKRITDQRRVVRHHPPPNRVLLRRWRRRHRFLPPFLPSTVLQDATTSRYPR